MVKLFENTEGNCLDFFKTVVGASPTNTNGTLFYRSDKEDFWFKVQIITDYFLLHDCLRHDHFLQLVDDKKAKQREQMKNEEAAKRLEIRNDVIEHLKEVYTLVEK